MKTEDEIKAEIIRLEKQREEPEHSQAFRNVKWVEIQELKWVLQEY